MSAVIENRSAQRRSACREISFEIVSSASRKLKRVPVTTGLCAAKGQLFEPGEWLFESAGAHAAVQTEVLNHWSDGSVRWLLARFVAGRVMPGRTSCTLIRPEKRPAPLTGASTLKIDDDRVSLTMRDQHQIPRTVHLRPALNSLPSCSFRLLTIEQESTGDICSTFLIQCELIDQPFVKLQLRIEAWPTCGHIKVEARLRNSRRAQHEGGSWDLGDAGSFEFDNFCLLVEDDEDTLSSEPNHDRPPFQVDLKTHVESDVYTASQFEIHQHGSGSEQWAHPNHVDSSGQVQIEKPGYTLTRDQSTSEGDRAQPVVGLRNRSECLTVAVPEFWQQFPTALAGQERRVMVGFFPAGASPHELQGGEQKTNTVWFSVRKDDHLQQLDWVHSPVRVLQSVAAVDQAGVFSWFPGSASFATEATSRYAAYITDATSGDFDFDARRSKIDEYGWRHFGDIHADHEQTHFAGEQTVVSHYNNQFDLILGAIQNQYVSGDADWFDFFDPYARHVMDIDIYHTDQDRACFNGGLFWHTDHYVDAATATHRTYSGKNAVDGQAYGGGPSCEHNYTTGLLYYYFLTGSREARETVLSLADWVIGMDDGRATIFSLLDDGPSGLASMTVLEDFHGPGRGVGNSINALLDAWILTGEQKYQQKCDELIQRSVHPDQDCDELHLIDAEGHWSYTVCLTALGRYLHHKSELDQRDEMYDYVRRTLVRYGRWMAIHERPTLSEPEKLQYPTEAWAAQDFRKANALRIAASCCDEPADERQMREKADEINDAAWRDLYAFDQQHLTARCLSILMTEGLRDVFHRECRPAYMPEAMVACQPQPWSMFVPQKVRVKQTLKNPLKLLRAGFGLLRPVRWKQFWRAFQQR